MKVIGNIIKFILAIILAICIIVCIGVNVASSTILSKDFVLQKLDETNYYANIYTAVESDFENYIYQSGLDEEVLENIVTPEKIENDTKVIINNIYDGTDEQIDITEIENNLRTNIEQSLNGNLSATQKKMVDEFINKITEQYQDTMTSTSYEDNIHNLLTKGMTIIKLVNVASIIGIVVFAILILVISFRRIWSGFMFIVSSAIASGVFYIFANILINAKVRIENITILNDAISITLREVLTSILNQLTTTGIIITIVGMIILIVFAMMDSYHKRKKEIEDESEEES
mgnify:FL=1